MLCTLGSDCTDCNNGKLTEEQCVVRAALHLSGLNLSAVDASLRAGVTAALLELCPGVLQVEYVHVEDGATPSGTTGVNVEFDVVASAGASVSAAAVDTLARVLALNASASAIASFAVALAANGVPQPTTATLAMAPRIKITSHELPTATHCATVMGVEICSAAQRAARPVGGGVLWAAVALAVSCVLLGSSTRTP
jgi:hypothetical protein